VRPWLRRATYAEQARSIATYLRQGETKLLEPLSGALANDATLVRAALVDCRLVLAPAALRDSLASIAWLVNQHLALKERQTLWSALEASRCGKPEAAERRWLRLHAAVGSANAAAMAAAAAAVLDNSADLPQDLLARAVAARIAGLILTDQAVPALRETSRYRVASATVKIPDPVPVPASPGRAGRADPNARPAAK